jgi:hypothetical protein
MAASNSHVRFYLAVVMVALLVAIEGCRQEKNGPATVEVAGTVSLDGNPVEGANVVFTPDAVGDDSRLASQATTDHEGRFRLSTNLGNGKMKSGIVAGPYLVAIAKYDSSAVKDTFTPPKNVLPQKYANAKTSQFKVEVIAGKVNDFPFDLHSK